MLLSVSAPSAQAAEVSVIPLNWEAGVGQPLQVDVSFSADGESINAIGGEVGFPQDILELEEIKDGNTIVSLWVERPRREGNKIVFSGVIPGGFKGENGFLFSLLFRTKKEGGGVIELGNMESFLNDGQGTPAPLKLFQLAFTVGKHGTVLQPPQREDKEPPESFAPEIARDETLFGGKWFLAFAAQDKKSGIDHYEVKESRGGVFGIDYLVLRKWQAAESPYVLRDQELRSYVFVKAVDKAGNERIVQLPPQNPLRWYEDYENWIIIIVLGIFAYVIWRVVHKC